MSIATAATRKSTNVQSRRRIPSVVRLAFAVLERVVPEVGARWAAYLWFRLPPQVRSRRPLTGGRPITVDVRGHTVAGMAWGDGPTVILVHGWAGHAGQLTSFVDSLVERGLRVVAFDALSHGASAPGAHGARSSTPLEFTQALSAVAAAEGPAYAIVAHSLGAAATAAALSDGLAAERVVFLAPMASPAIYAEILVTALGAGERVRSRLQARIERRVGAPFHHFDVAELGRDAAMPPTLVIHDADDSETPLSGAEAIAAAWPDARLRVTRGLGHRRLLRDPEVVQEVAEFVAGG